MKARTQRPVPRKRSTAQAMEQFAQFVALGMKQADAYRKATATKAKDETVYVKASIWADKVRVRIDELRAVADRRMYEEKAGRRRRTGLRSVSGGLSRRTSGEVVLNNS